MNNKWKLILGIGGLVVLIGGAALLYQSLSSQYRPDTASSASDSSASSEAPKAAPDFTVYDASGKAVKLSDFRGKPVVLNFWASWCGYCKKEMPDFNDVYAASGKDVTFLMVDTVDGQYETQAAGQQYVASQKFSFPVYFDNDQQASEAYGISGIPETVLIDAKGNIVTIHEGYMEKVDLQRGIKALLSSKS